MKEMINQIIPKPMRPVLKRIYYFFADHIELWSGQRDPLIPPKRMLHSYEGDFKKIGEEYLRCFMEVADLKRNERVLDVGCGIGRVAVALTKYLDKEGGYEGFDIVPEWVNWCIKKISPKYPNFRFQLVDVFNSRYNQNGRWKASEYKFPYGNELFDFVFLTSVFTHMLPEDMENYFSEIARVLKRNGRCFISFFLSNAESLQLMNDGKCALDFKYEFGDYRSIDSNSPEMAVCYDEPFVLDLYEKYGLKEKQSVLYGSWCGRSKFYSYQDIIVTSKG
jgi:ubiquinone/menaquinone biosynthesis C-methylase UbiE